MAKTSFSLLHLRPAIFCTALLLLLLSPYGATSSSLHDRRHRRGSGHNQEECNIERLKSQRPSMRIESEAGVSEIWDETEQQFECAGVSPERHTIQPNGLILPSYSNYPTLNYIIQGQGVGGVVISGCPETFQSFRQGDKHQTIQELRQGDIVAIPAGVSSWIYNTGNTPLVLVSISDISSHNNQLDQTPRVFFLAGSIPEERTSTRQSRESRRRSDRRTSSDNIDNIFSGFDTEILSEAFGVDKETARKLKSTDRRRGFIIKVDNLQVTKPTSEEESSRRRESSRSNGMEELMCNMHLVHHIDNPRRSADVYNREAGYLSDITQRDLPILYRIDLAATRGHLRRDAIFAPHWHMNSHSIIYVIRGSARMQIVNNNGESVHDDRVKEGEFIVVPQSFVVMMKAMENDFDWVAFKTTGSPIMSSLVGKTSILRGLPEDVLRNSYGISREEARRLKYGREEETMLVRPSSTSTSSA